MPTFLYHLSIDRAINEKKIRLLHQTLNVLFNFLFKYVITGNVRCNRNLYKNLRSIWFMYPTGKYIYKESKMAKCQYA